MVVGGKLKLFVAVGAACGELMGMSGVAGAAQDSRPVPVTLPSITFNGSSATAKTGTWASTPSVSKLFVKWQARTGDSSAWTDIGEFTASKTLEFPTTDERLLRVVVRAEGLDPSDRTVVVSPFVFRLSRTSYGSASWTVPDGVVSLGVELGGASGGAGAGGTPSAADAGPWCSTRAWRGA